MPRATPVCTSMLLTLAVACGPTPAGTSATDSASGETSGGAGTGSTDAAAPTTSTAAPTTDASTDAPATGSTTAPTTTDPTATEATTTTDDCGPPPGKLACEVDPRPPDPAVSECEARPQASCDGPLAEDDGIHSCAWAELTAFAQDDLACAAGEPVARCIALAYQGDGCAVPGSCGILSPLTRYWRLAADCRIEVMPADFCESQPVGWDSCYWSDIVVGDCDLPWPEEGPAACNCNC